MTEPIALARMTPERDIASRSVPVPAESCPVCGSEQLMPLRCKVICQGCRTIVQSCADL